ncbi:MAG: SGNH/GDSL hydrolase family protein [Saprospiraceae bacterium]|nr:SGNH/GDSL hydrolase family protein [Saprospiraceae bacterium]
MQRFLQLLAGVLLCGLFSASAQTDTILIDFGNNLSPAPWNNLTDPVAGQIGDLINSAGQPTGRSIAVYDPFNNINTAGTLSPVPAIGFPPTATGDSFFGNTATFGGQIQETGGVELAGLDPNKEYAFTIFASRISVADNREARYTFQGLTTEIADLDASNNADMVTTATLRPDANGVIRIEAAPGPNNNNGTGFYYLGALYMVYEQDPPPPPAMDTILIDFGNVLSPAPWNNLTEPIAGLINDLINTAGQSTGRGIAVYDAFNNINTVGTQSPDPALGFPPTATGDSFFGNTATFGGQIQPTGGVELFNLNPEKEYTFTVFASRISVADNREARYTFQGLTTEIADLDASNNADMVTTATLRPDANGVIRMEAAPGPNNNNGTGFYYLGAMSMMYEAEEPPVAVLQDTLLIDFGPQLSPAPWNNVTDPAEGRVNNLVNKSGALSGKGVAVFDAFNNVNTAGTTSPSPSIGFPASATGDSFYGNTGLFAGQVQPTGGVELFNLDPSKPHTVAIFASRVGGDMREAQYLIEGLSTETVLLNASSNTDMVAVATLLPDADGIIRITASPGPNNNTASGFFHLGAMRISFEREEPPVIPLADTLLIDFGNNLSPAPWNNITDPAAGQIDNLLRSAGDESGISIAVYDPFNNINTGGTLSPDPALGFPPTATGDSFFGNTGTFGGQMQPTGGVELANLNPDKAYTFTVFASRTASADIREARYTFQGLTTEIADLDASNNVDMVATATLFPDENGIIRMEAAPGPNNNNTTGFFYLGAMKVAYDRDPPPVVLMDTLLVDFGNNLSPLPWNNVADPVAGNIDDLLTSGGFSSGKSVFVYDSFNNINTAGTISPDPAIGFPPTATGDSFFGNTATFGGQIQPTGGVEFANLNPNKAHTFLIFASRTASPDNREARYTLQGLSQETVLLNASNNTNIVATATLFPSNEGIIRVEAAPGPNNDNASGFYYLNAMKVIYEQEEIGPAELSLVSPNGGEYWQVDKTPAIIWESKNLGSVTLEYSTDNGGSWTSIATVPAVQKEYTWTVPNTPSTECLVRVSSDTLSDVSNGVFEIADDDVTCRIVVLGSSTAEGTGAVPVIDSSWVNRYRKEIFQKNTRYAVTNLARGGYTTYHILPTGTTIPPGVNVTIDPVRNITHALTLDPYAIIINMPSNDAANTFGVQEQLDNIALVAATANSGGAGVWVGTTQPRNFTNPAQILLQTIVRDSILSIYGDFAIDFWTGLAAPNGFIDPAYNSGDGIHINNAGHRLLYERVLAKGIDTIDCTIFSGTPDVVMWNDVRLNVFPNPFQDSFTIEFETKSAAEVELRVTDLLGRQVMVVKETFQQAGIHRLQVDGLPVAAVGRQMLFGMMSIQQTQGLSRGSVKLVRH